MSEFCSQWMSVIGIRDSDTMCDCDTRGWSHFTTDVTIIFISWFGGSDEEVLEKPTQKRRFYTEHPCFHR